MRILRIKNAKFSGYCFYMNTNIKRDFQICISVPWTLTWRSLLSYRHQSIYLLHKSMDWFLHDNDLRRERVNGKPDFAQCGQWRLMSDFNPFKSNFQVIEKPVNWFRVQINQMVSSNEKTLVVLVLLYITFWWWLWSLYGRISLKFTCL